jgi:hypothetical protein
MKDVVLKEYVRKEITNRNGKRQLVPVGTLTAECYDGEIMVGYSQCHTKLDNYDKEYGVFLARNRAPILADRLALMEVESEGSTWYLIDPKPLAQTDYEEIHKARMFPSAIMGALPGFLVRCEKYFKQGKLTPWAAKIRAAMGA